MNKKKFYAVVKGRIPGIYTVWFGKDGAQAQVNGFNGAVFKGFPTRSEAEAFMKNGPTWKTGKKPAAIPKSMSTPKAAKASWNGRNRLPKEGQVVIYTDGGALGNPGPGGYAAVIVNEHGRRELSGGYRLTTNNRMELTACIIALKSLEKPSSVMLHSDSKYVVDGITKGWARKWRSNNWMRTKKDKAVNPDLWEQLLDLCDEHDVEFKWVKGHAGNPGNERCDALVRMESAKSGLPPDTVYEASR